jgi:hypothetical protein
VHLMPHRERADRRPFISAVLTGTFEHLHPRSRLHLNGADEQGRRGVSAHLAVIESVREFGREDVDSGRVDVGSLVDEAGLAGSAY